MIMILEMTTSREERIRPETRGRPERDGFVFL